MVPAHYIVELALVGCPDPDPIYTRFFTPGRATLAAGSGRDRPRATSARWPTRSRSGWCGSIAQDGRAPIGVSFSGGIDSGSVFLADLSRDAAAGHGAGAAQGVRAESRRTGRTSNRRARFCPQSGCRCSSRRSTGSAGRSRRRSDAARARGLQDARRRVRGDGPAALQGHSRTVSRLAASRRRRRRRREPEGLSDRRKPGAHDPQRRRQPDALPGRLGRRPDQALADLQRRSQPELRAYLRAGDRSTGSPASAPTRGRTSSTSPRRFPSRR